MVDETRDPTMQFKGGKPVLSLIATETLPDGNKREHRIEVAFPSAHEYKFWKPRFAQMQSVINVADRLGSFEDNES